MKKTVLTGGVAVAVVAAAVAGGDKTRDLLSAVAYNDGEIRVTEDETLDRDTLGKSRVIAKFSQTLAAVPALRLVNSDGTTAPSGGWKLFFGVDHKTLMFGRNIGTVVIAR